jgi:hypothetical protein
VSQDRESLTGRLIDVIQMIQLSRGTCQLKVKRGKGPTAEEAYLAFANGQLVEAKSGYQTGMEAFNRISVWKDCQVMFVSSNQANAAPPVISIQHEDHNAHEPTMRPPAPPFQAISPLRKRAGSLEGGEKNTQEREPSMIPLSPSAVPVSIKPLNISLQMIEQKELSRVHRQLFLLVDGQRSCAQLVRLTGRKMEEVEKMLRDLQRIGVIRL